MSLPLDCRLGQDCYIEDYVDRDDGDGFADYACGLKTRNGHRGTDFALVSLSDFARGVPVLAAADGVVAAIRDGMADTPYSEDDASRIEGRECGNAVRIRHGNGLQTLYCHLRKGSVEVRTGQAVARGDRLGVVGMSGETNYPHVHFTVIGPDGLLDPFRPAADATCADPGPSLWLNAEAYTPTGMFTAGFSNRVPSFADVKSGAARLQQIPATAPLVLYSHFYHSQPGDKIELRATRNGSDVFARTEDLKDPKASHFRAYGRKAPAGGWMPGLYLGRATLTRNGVVLAVRFTQVTVP